ncbi:MAG: efflux RND transporter periplasmic adaptor subunit [Gammaproteobacteria bacterium]|nr:efflux RND transporter periplasmic adaptor subunit [Gammaproteobacteria bacterium]
MNKVSRRQSRTHKAVTLALLLWTIGFTHAADLPLPVRVIDLAAIAEAPLNSAPAVVVARHAPQIAAEIDARIVELPVDVGDPVVAGTELARFDCRRTEASLASARAEVERSMAQRGFAAAQLERARDLGRSKSISDELLQQRRTELAAASADLALREQQRLLAQIDVDHCTLRSPISGVVTRRHASLGDYATRGRAIVDLVERDGQEVSVALRHDQVTSLRKATRITFEINGESHPLALRTMLPQIDSATRTREARLLFEQQAADPGSAGRVQWLGGETLLPADLLVRRDGRLGVFILRDDVATFVALADAQDGRPAVVQLDPATRLITDGRQRLSDGDPVRVIGEAE